MNGERHPEAGIPGPTLGEAGERGLIRLIRDWVGDAPAGSVGIGDDCAIVPAPGRDWDLALTSDPMIEGRHFLPNTDPRRIGHKAVGRVLSDLAAMGAEPLWILVDLVAPREMPVSKLKALYAGATDLCRRYGAVIAGGDTACGEILELHVFGVGRVPGGQAALRSGGRVGDAIFVTGALGGSLSGHHLDFEPKLAEGLWLRSGHWISAMMDVSDGLASDLRRIFEQSRVGGLLKTSRIPISEAARIAGGDPVAHALCDGEDYELLFCVPAEKADELEAAWSAKWDEPCFRIGELIDQPGELLLEDADGVQMSCPKGGYEHFNSRT
ncbi:MAG: thiamine-phosphate kinase [Kiritimatiellia bacterium]|nr:thiamine-phosphate kinase [Kiritimatiellia bacterium]